MALKAGYYGVKKAILDELQKLDGILPIDVSKNNKLISEKTDSHNIKWPTAIGSVKKNIIKNTASTGSANGILHTINTDKSVSLSGTATATDLFWINTNFKSLLEVGKYYILTGCPEGGGENTYKLDIRGIDGGSTVVLKADVGNANGFIVTSDMLNHDAIGLCIRVANGVNMGTAENPTVFKPMIRDGEIKDYSYAQFIKSNIELDNDITAVNNIVNAIIAAATGAADFAAFKTAMGEITPVTRSLSIQSPETREVSDPEPETRTTKRSAKKTETTE